MSLLRDFRYKLHGRIYDVFNSGGSPVRLCFWSFLLCIVSVMVYPSVIWHRLTWRKRKKMVSVTDDDIPF